MIDGTDTHRLGFMTKKNASQKNLDKSSLFNLRKGIVRVEYPGLVRNESEAISTLGGMHSIESAIADKKEKLELCLNPKNMLCKPVAADRDHSAGILIKIIKNGDELDYDLVAVVTTHFKFNRLAEFVYLPLMPKNGQESDVEFLYDKLFPEKLPTFEWLISRESASMPAMLFPPCSARNEYCNQNKLGHFHQAAVREKHVELPNRKQPPLRTLSFYISFQNINTEVPDQPYAGVMEKVRSKGLMDKYLVLKKLFDERPIYLRSAIRHLTRFLNENLKILLPAVAYYCTLGPWRTTWIRYGYNPQKDFNSRKYQTLDFRLKSNAELNSRARQRGRHIANLKPFNDEIDESSYLLKPDIIPPRKQRLYQYCDILLPEIQEMLQRLPKLPTYVKYDIKNGWFPARFIEQSREIVRNHMREQLKKRYQEERLKPTDAQTSEGDEGSLAYGSRMLSNLARARHRSVGEPGTSQVEEAIDEDAQEADVIDLIDDEDEEEEADADQERLLHGEEGDRDYDSDENSDNSSQYEIDTEALEEINKMVSGAGSIFK